MSEVRQMKWVIDNLGITREAIKYYDKKGLISPHRESSSNNRRVFDEDDLEQLWTIRFLMETGFSSNEILEMQRGKLSFFDSVADKVEQLERDIESKQIALSFVKTVKLTGQFPTLKNMGEMTFRDFFEYSQSNWNFADNENITTLEKATETIEALGQGKISDLAGNDIDKLIDFFGEIGPIDEVAVLGVKEDTLSSLLLSMDGLDPADAAVQNVVAALFDVVSKLAPEELTKDRFARAYSWKWDDCDLGRANRSLHGEEACDFMLACLARFGSVAND